ncbi:MAG: hypothetical protein GXP62_15560, partial [Oligoflexia bacterium]|nr:hypothetical protein [Oligoflexia bacterium]
MIAPLLSSALLVALLGSAWAAGPLSPAPQDDGTDGLDGAAELPADSGAGLLYFGARSPFTKAVQGEFFGGFAGQVGIARAVSIGLAMPDARRLSLSGDAHR